MFNFFLSKAAKLLAIKFFAQTFNFIRIDRYTASNENKGTARKCFQYCTSFYYFLSVSTCIYY